jgi:hypothetical protein
LRMYTAHNLLCASGTLDLQKDCADVPLQGAGRPERHAWQVAVYVRAKNTPVPAPLLKKRGSQQPAKDNKRWINQPQAAGVVPALLVHRLDVRRQAALLPEGDQASLY